MVWIPQSVANISLSCRSMLIWLHDIITTYLLLHIHAVNLPDVLLKVDIIRWVNYCLCNTHAQLQYTTETAFIRSFFCFESFCVTSCAGKSQEMRKFLNTWSSFFGTNNQAMIKYSKIAFFSLFYVNDNLSSNLYPWMIICIVLVAHGRLTG